MHRQKCRSKLKTCDNVATLRKTMGLKESVECKYELLLSLKPFFSNRFLADSVWKAMFIVQGSLS